MNTVPVKTVAKYAMCGCLVSFFVALLTVIFSFLGTIFCALLAGMMMSAARASRWLLLPTSLLFPAVIFAALRLWKTELLESQVIGVSVLCFSAFWLAYAVAAAVAAFERKAAPTTARVSRRVAVDTVAPSETAVRLIPRAARPIASAATTSAAPAARLSLELLQGKWRSESAGHQEPVQQRELEIRGSCVVLQVFGTNGQPAFVAKGEMRLSG